MLKPAIVEIATNMGVDEEDVQGRMTKSDWIDAIFSLVDGKLNPVKSKMSDSKQKGNGSPKSKAKLQKQSKQQLVDHALDIGVHEDDVSGKKLKADWIQAIMQDGKIQDGKSPRL